MPPRWRLAGILIAALTTAIVVGAMLPLRSHLDIAIVALILVIPVVIGAAVGGFLAGLLAVAVGFVAYDYFFIPPYGTLTVGQTEDWAALAVYVVVMTLVSRVVDRLWQAEAASRDSQRDTARLFELSELLVGDRPSADLFGIIVNSVKEAFDLTRSCCSSPHKRPSPTARHRIWSRSRWRGATLTPKSWRSSSQRPGHLRAFGHSPPLVLRRPAPSERKPRASRPSSWP